MTGTVAGWSSLIHVGIGGAIEVDQMVYGDQNPSIYLVPGATKLYFATSLNNDRDYHRDSGSLVLDQWNDIHVSQRLDKNGNYVWRIIVNNNIIHETINTQPIEIQSAKVWLGNPWHPPAVGRVRNLHIVSDDCAAGTKFDGTSCAPTGNNSIIYM